MIGDVATEGQELTIEAADRPGFSVIAYDQGICSHDDLGDKALLVFLRRNPPRHGPDRPYYVYACPVLDKETREELRQHEVCFEPDPPTYFCPKR
jgi:hypothetical protein